MSIKGNRAERIGHLFRRLHFADCLLDIASMTKKVFILTQTSPKA